MNKILIILILFFLVYQLNAYDFGYKISHRTIGGQSYIIVIGNNGGIGICRR